MREQKNQRQTERNFFATLNRLAKSTPNRNGQQQKTVEIPTAKNRFAQEIFCTCVAWVVARCIAFQVCGGKEHGAPEGVYCLQRNEQYESSQRL